MKFPRQVFVDGKCYPVGKLPRTSELHGCITVDMVEEKDRCLLVHPRQSDRQHALTFLHEICHAVLAPLKLNASHEERIVQRLETGLASALENNPTLFRHILSILRRTRSR